MKPHVPNAHVLSSVATGLLMLLCRPVFAVGAEPVPPRAPFQARREVGHPQPAGNREQLKEMDRLIDGGEYTEAEDKARAALASVDAAGEGDSYEAALAADRLVEALLQGGKWTRPETLGRAEMAVHVKETLLGPNSVETARSLERLSRVLARRSDFSEAHHLLDRSLVILETSQDSVGLDVANVRHSIGTTLFLQGQYESAVPWLTQAIAIRREILGRDDAAVAESLRVVGDCAKQRNDLQEALQALRQSERIYENASRKRSPHLAGTLTSIGQTLRGMEDYAGAKSNLERAVAIVEDSLGGESPLVAAPLSALGLTLMDTGDYVEAERSLERALTVQLQEYGHDDPGVASALNNLGILRGRTGDYARAEDNFAEAARIYEARMGPWYPEIARCLNNRGILLSLMGRPAEAELDLTRALDIRIRQFGSDNLGVATGLNNLAMLEESLGDFAKAKEYGLRALAIVDKLKQGGPYQRGVILDTLSGAARGLGETDDAAKYAGEASAIFIDKFGPHHPDVATALATYARVLAEDGQDQAGLSAAIESEGISRDHLILSTRTSTEREALAYASARVSTINLLVTMAGRRSDLGNAAVKAAWDCLIRSRALVLDEMVTRRRVIIQSSDPETVRLRDELSQAAERLAKLVVAGPNDSDAETFKKNMAAARTDMDRAERALAARSDGFRRHLMLSRTGLDVVLSALPRDAALVAFVQYGRVSLAKPVRGKVQPMDQSTPSYAAFVMSPSKVAAVLVPLGEAATINALVERWRVTLSLEANAGGRVAKGNEAAYRDAATRLRRAVWDPIAAHLEGAGEVLVVPDGSLNLVNFVALPAGEQEYLIERGPVIHYLSSERDLLITSDTVAANRGLLTLSNPDFGDRTLYATLRSQAARSAPVSDAAVAEIYRGARSACSSFQSMRFEPLPASLLETEEITRIWGNQENGGSSLPAASDSAESAVSFTGPGATETIFKRTAGGHRVLHLATHGFFLGGDCESALESPATDSTASASRAVTRENPLLLSGLVLAGANHREAAGPDEDDGILTAEEIATLNLQGTEWAVLSACDTGTGEIRAGEGVFGLRRAFQLAGAHTVIMSLWSVEDEATRQWMAALYRHRFVEGKTTAESVNDASLDLLQQRRARGESTHPFYWAGFIAAGDWR